MILHAELLMIGCGGDIQHVFDPVVAVGHLEFIPVDSLILEAAMPIEPEAEQIDIEVIFGGHVFYGKTGVKYSDEPRVAEPRVINRICETLDEGNGIALRIADLEMGLDDVFVVPVS